MKRITRYIAAVAAAALVLTCACGAWSINYPVPGGTIEELPEAYDLRDVDGCNYTAAVHDYIDPGYSFTSSFNTALESLLLQKYNRRYEFSDEAALEEFFEGDNAAGNMELTDGTPIMIASRYLDKGPATNYGYENSEALSSGVRLTSVEQLKNPSLLSGLNIAGGLIEQIKRALLDGEAVVTTGDNYFSFTDEGELSGMYLYQGYYQDVLIPNHTYQIIGWNDTIPSEMITNYGVVDSFTTKYPDGAWLVQDSSGASYATGGTFYIGYYTATLYDCALILKDAEIGYSFDTSYSLDPLGYNTSLGFSGNNYVSYAANVFTREDANSAESLSELTIATSAATDYEIYVNPSSEDLAGATVKAAEGTIDYSGYTNIKLDEAVKLTGDKFAVVVRYETPGKEFNVPVESRDSSLFNTTYSTATAHRGESFISRDGESWTEISTRDYDYSNCSIKAFTVGDNSGSSLVSFDVIPTASSVYVSDGENDVEPRDDGSYYLAEGDYSYTVAGGTDGEVSGEFTVTADDVANGSKVISVTLATAPSIYTDSISVLDTQEAYIPLSLGTGSLRATDIASVRIGGHTLKKGVDYTLWRNRSLLLTLDGLKQFLPGENDVESDVTVSITMKNSASTKLSCSLTIFNTEMLMQQFDDE